MTNFSELDQTFKSALKNSKLLLLHNVYCYNKKKQFSNFNWMITELQRWGVIIPNIHYSSMMEVQIKLSELKDTIPASYIEYVLGRINKNVGKPYFENPKYKQARYLYRVYKKHADSIKPTESISWIQGIFPEAYDAITADDVWFKRVHLHIDRMHTALQKLLRTALQQLSIPFGDRDGLVRLYETLTSKAIESTKEISLIATDAKTLEILNSMRNNKSLAHANNIEIIPEDIGIAFVEELCSIAEKINIFLQNS